MTEPVREQGTSGWDMLESEAALVSGSGFVRAEHL